MLYGSCARGDQDSSSDVDLFALQSSDFYKMTAYSKLNIVYYSEELLRERVANGNLFCLHLAEEGKIISDSENLLSEILSQFEYRDSYKKEIKEASNLAWVLIKFAEKFDNYLYLNRKLVWTIRTILIAQSAEVRDPVFSKKELVEFSNNKNLSRVIDLKKTESFDRKALNLIPEILNDLGCKRPSWLKSLNSIKDSKGYFSEGSYPNKVISKSRASYSI